VQLAPGPDGHPQIAEVFAGGAAEAAKLEAGDVVLAVDGADTAAPGAFSGALAGKRAGEIVRLTILRGEEELARDVTLAALPFEQSDRFDVIYDVVETDAARLRCVLTKPKGATGRLPAMLFVQGLQCSPPDQPLGEPSTILQLIHEITAAGWVVMRCEKPGSGDATGPPCSEIGFHDEVAGFRAALAKLMRYDFVDPAHVTIFGHSMGGIQAPILAAETPVAGVIVFGTGVIPWAEYLVENERRQTRLDPSADLPALETRCRDLADFLHEVFRKNRPIADVVAERPGLTALADDYWPDRVHSFGHHVDYYRELDAVNLAETWSQVDAPVLAVWGDLDYTTCAAEHEYLAQIVNAKHAGAARVAVLPNVFHAFNVRESVAQSLEAPWQGPLAESVVETVLEWLRTAGG